MFFHLVFGGRDGDPAPQHNSPPCDSDIGVIILQRIAVTYIN